MISKNNLRCGRFYFVSPQISIMFLSPGSDIFYAVMLVLMQCRLRGQRSQAVGVGFQPCPLCTEVSPDSLNPLRIVVYVLRSISTFLESEL